MTKKFPSVKNDTILKTKLIRLLKEIYYLTEVGQHYYWSILSYQVHGQVLINSWIVILIIVAISLSTTKQLNLVPESGQSFIEFVTEFIRDIAKNQIGEKEYLKWVPYIGTMFLFIFVSNWSGALIPWKVIELPNGELGAPTNDMCELKLIRLNFEPKLLSAKTYSISRYNLKKNIIKT